MVRWIIGYCKGMKKLSLVVYGPSRSCEPLDYTDKTAQYNPYNVETSCRQHFYVKSNDYSLWTEILLLLSYLNL